MVEISYVVQLSAAFAFLLGFNYGVFLTLNDTPFPSITMEVRDVFSSIMFIVNSAGAGFGGGILLKALVALVFAFGKAVMNYCRRRR